MEALTLAWYAFTGLRLLIGLIVAPAVAAPPPQPFPAPESRQETPPEPLAAPQSDDQEPGKGVVAPPPLDEALR